MKRASNELRRAGSSYYTTAASTHPPSLPFFALSSLCFLRGQPAARIYENNIEIVRLDYTNWTHICGTRQDVANKTEHIKRKDIKTHEGKPSAETRFRVPVISLQDGAT